MSEDPKRLIPDDHCGVKDIYETDGRDPFNPFCAGHDKGYVYGGSENQLDATDHTLVSLMWEKTKKNWWLFPRFIVYAVLVETFGRFTWKKK